MELRGGAALSFLDDLGKAMPALAGLIGASVAASYNPSPLSRRHWYSILVSGSGFAYFVSPIGAGAIRHHWPFPWLPADSGLEGVLGFLLGILGIYLVGGLMAIGTKVAQDPLDLIPFLRRLRK